MPKTSMVVPLGLQHKNKSRGDPMAEKEKPEYAATYKFGNTTVRVVAPPPMTEEEKEKILGDFHRAGWAIIEELVEKGEAV